MIPFLIIISNLADRGLQGDSIPKFAYDLYRNLSPKYEKRARLRVESKQAENMSIEDISGTEWPVFGEQVKDFSMPPKAYVSTAINRKSQASSRLLSRDRIY